MKIEIKTEVLNRAKITATDCAVCTCIDKGSTYKDAAELFGISASRAGKIYAKHAESLQDIARELDAECARAEQEIYRDIQGSAERALAMQSHPFLRRYRSYTQVCTDHFAAARARWPSLNFQDYTMLRAVSFWTKPTSSSLAIMLGEGRDKARNRMYGLARIGAILSVKKQEKPVLTVADFHAPKRFFYEVLVHDFFTDIKNR